MSMPEDQGWVLQSATGLRRKTRINLVLIAAVTVVSAHYNLCSVLHDNVHGIIDNKLAVNKVVTTSSGRIHYTMIRTKHNDCTAFTVLNCHVFNIVLYIQSHSVFVLTYGS